MENINIDIVKSNSPSQDYFALIAQLYGNSDAVKFFANDTQKGLDKVTEDVVKQPTFFIAANNSRLLGQIALIPQDERNAFFGFFECINEDCFKLLWANLVDEAKKQGFNTLFGPVNGTTWHPYRFVVKSSVEPFFPSEPLTDLRYFQWFLNQNASQVIEYHSAFRTDFTPILQSTAASYQDALENGIAIAVEEVGINNIQDLYEMAIGVFSQNPGYTHLSFGEFVSLYSSEKLSKSKGVLYAARFQNQLLGFSLNLEYGNSLIMKTIAVKPNLWQKGIGNAMVHKVHVDATEKGVRKVIYALVRKDNNVKHFTTEKINVFREYSAYLFNI